MYNVVITETAEKELKKLFKKSRIDYNNIIDMLNPLMELITPENTENNLKDLWNFFGGI